MLLWTRSGIPTLKFERTSTLRMGIRRILGKRPKFKSVMFIFGFFMVYCLCSDLFFLHDATTLVGRSYIQTLVPRDADAVVMAPDVTHVTNNTVLVFVTSALLNSHKRQLIRQTWANRRYTYNSSIHKRTISVIFIIGREVDKHNGDDDLDLEMRANKDILLVNVVDTYDTLTVKAILAMKWIYTQLSEVKFFIKIDDDMLLNTLGCLNAIDALESNNISCFIAGPIWPFPVVRRIGKYVVNMDKYSHFVFPSFSGGLVYLMTRDSMAAILEASEHVPFLNRDDVYFTGILARSMGIPLFTFPTGVVLSGPFHIDKLVNSPLIAMHGMNEVEWRHMWTALRGRQIKGEKYKLELRSLYPYEYGLRVAKLSESINGLLKHECQSEFTLNMHVWS